MKEQVMGLGMREGAETWFEEEGRGAFSVHKEGNQKSFINDTWS